jgi:flagellar motor switch protein FliN/FliY
MADEKNDQPAEPGDEQQQPAPEQDGAEPGAEPGAAEPAQPTAGDAGDASAAEVGSDEASGESAEADGSGGGDDDLAAAALAAAAAAVDSLNNETASAAGDGGGGGDAEANGDASSTAGGDVATAAATPSGSASGDDGSQPVDLPQFDKPQAGEAREGIDLLNDVNLNVKIELGRTRMLVEDVLRLAAGAVVELDKLAGDPVDVYVNDRLVARGEVLVLNDNFCVRVSEIVSLTPQDQQERAKVSV